MFATMSAASRVAPQAFGRLPIRAITVSLQLAALITFGVVAVALLSLAIAEPIALPIAQRSGIPVSPAEIADAHRLGAMWPIFAAASAAAFGGGLVTIGALLQHLAPKPD
jgi:hypothetical protein